MSSQTNAPQYIVPKPSDLLGQEELVAHFGCQVLADELPHALLLAGEEGGEAFSLALVLARQLLCDHLTSEGMPCGHCQSCRQMDELQHPDFTLVFPVVRGSEGKETTSEQFLESFRKVLRNHQRFTSIEWRAELEAGNRQPQIMVAEAERLIHASSLCSFKSNHQVILIWQPETMRTETANKLLKLLEEPPKGVVFIMVSHHPAKLLPTILSRLQRVTVPKISEELLASYLITHEGVAAEQARELSHLSQGNLYTVLELESRGGGIPEQQEALYFLSLPLQRNPKPLLEAAQEYAQKDRPEVIALLDSSLPLLRELLALRYGSEEVVFLSSGVLDGAKTLCQAIPLAQYPVMMEEISRAKSEAVQNGNITMILFDLLLTFTRLYQKIR